MRGTLTLKILEAVAQAAGDISDGLTAFLDAGYGASLGKLEYGANRHKRERMRQAAAREIETRTRQRYYMMLYHIRKQGLVVEKGDHHKSILFLTYKGRERMRELKKKLSCQLPAPRYEAPKESSAIVIVAFDVPEKERKKRAWLREALKNLGLRMAQQSLWIGKKKLPKEFLDDLLRLRLVEFVEIFEVTKSGTLSPML